jgi:hypothetical protein
MAKKEKSISEKKNMSTEQVLFNAFLIYNKF